MSLRSSYSVGQSDLLEDAVAQLEVARGADIARVRDVDVDDLLDAGGAGVEDDDAVGELDGFVDVVGDEDDGLALGVPDAEEFAAHDEAGDGVEGAEGLVEEEHVGVDGEGAGDFEALLHAAGELVGVGLFEAFEADHFYVIRDAFVSFGAREFEEAEADVALHGEPGEDAALLEDEDAASVGAGDGFVVDADGSAGGGEEAGHGVEEGRFAAAGGADEADELAVVDGEVDVGEDRGAFAVAREDHVDVVHAEFRGGGWVGVCGDGHGG